MVCGGFLEDEPDIEVVEEAGNADDALQKLGKHQPDVVDGYRYAGYVIARGDRLVQLPRLGRS